jgi:sortase A
VLLRVGIAMLLFSVALAAVVAVVVNLSGGGESPDEPRAVGMGSTEPERASGEPERRPSEERDAEPLPVVSSDDWPLPSNEEVAATEGPRFYAPNQDAELTLTVEAIGLYDVPIISSSSEEALDNGVIHVPQTPMPWEEREQKNVYLAGHRLGFPGTGSRLVFYNLDKLSAGDSITLKDSQGIPYEYQVSEVFVVDPNADWAVDPVRGRDMVTLQTCTFPNFENRLIVRADRAGDAGLA